MMSEVWMWQGKFVALLLVRLWPAPGVSGLGGIAAPAALDQISSP